MSLFYRQLPMFILGALLGTLIALGHGVFANKEDGAAAKLPVEELRAFSEVYSKIKEDYVEEVGDDKLLEYAIEGMLSGLDPHSAYLNPDDFNEMQVGTSGEFGGLGIEVGMEDGFVKVIAPIDDTPAQRAGIEAGDLIVKLNEVNVKGLTLNEAVKIMRGKPGEEITLTIVREGKEKPLKIKIVRDIIRVKSVRGRMLEPGYAYLRVSQFQTHTVEDLQKKIQELLTENSGELKGVVLDLRNNPGGILNAAVGVADIFLKDGLIVYTKGRVKDSEMRFTARPKDLLEDTAMVTLVNNGSASASEIVAGALQDHKRSLIMGSRTFGKGSVQTILPMNDTKSAIKITTARYYTPSGRSIQAEGIVPDIALNKVEIASVQVEDEDHRIREADLKGHLNKDKEADKVPTLPVKPNSTAPTEDNNDGAAQPTENKSEKTEKDENEPLIKKDYALHEALSLLKGLSIMRAH